MTVADLIKRLSLFSQDLQVEPETYVHSGYIGYTRPAIKEIYLEDTKGIKVVIILLEDIEES
jgi:hypothetical protein